MLVVEGTIKDAAFDRVRGEHTCNERAKFDVAVIELVRNGTSELHLVGLEAEVSVNICSIF